MGTICVGPKIIHTKGDTLAVALESDTYIPAETDKISFKLKHKYSDTDVIYEKEISPSEMLIQLTSEETKKLQPGKYVYDVEITYEDGTVDTVLGKLQEAVINIVEEV